MLFRSTRAGSRPDADVALTRRASRPGRRVWITHEAVIRTHGPPGSGQIRVMPHGLPVTTPPSTGLPEPAWPPAPSSPPSALRPLPMAGDGSEGVDTGLGGRRSRLLTRGGAHTRRGRQNSSVDLTPVPDGVLTTARARGSRICAASVAVGPRTRPRLIAFAMISGIDATTPPVRAAAHQHEPPLTGDGAHAPRSSAPRRKARRPDVFDGREGMTCWRIRSM